MTLNFLSVRIYAPNINPPHINPEYLRVNGITLPDWEITPPIMLESGLSRISYENGLYIQASQSQGSRGNLFFSQRRLNIQSTESVTLEVVRRYLNNPPYYLHISAMTISTAFLVSEVVPSDRDSTRSATGTPFGEVVPSISLRSVYQFENKQMEITIEEGPLRSSADIIYLGVRGRVHYVVREDTPINSIGFALGILDEQKSEFDLLVEISRLVFSQYLALENSHEHS